MKKSKAKEIDSLYIPEEDKKKKKKEKNKKIADKKKSADKKKGKKVAEEGTKKSSQTFDFDDEIVIGITKKEDKPNKDKNKEKKKDNKKKKDKKEDKRNDKKTSKKQDNRSSNVVYNENYNNAGREKKKSNRRALRIIKYSLILFLLIGAIVALMMSSIFNVKTITVSGNNHLSTEEITSLSEIVIDQNIFRLSKGKTEKNIKENPYVENVKVSRKLPSEISIEIEERVPTYMLEYAGSYVYINNQGYMLEISEEKIPVPVISGTDTPIESYKAGNRLIKEDLLKLETVLKIMDTLGSYDLAESVTGINIADKTNYTLYMEGELKTVYLGNASNINTRIMYLKEIIEREKGINSEVFLNKDINKDNVYTREKV